LDQLRRILGRIDGRGYRAYKDLQGSYALGDVGLHIDHVQGDPYAAPSKLRLRVAQGHALIPEELFANAARARALEDFLAREVYEAIRRIARGSRGSGKSGAVQIDAGRQEVLERTAAVVTSEYVEARIEVGLPAAGRRILAREAEAILCDELPAIAEEALFWENLPQDDAQRFVECVENQEHIRGELDARGLVAFVADGAVLPRQSGASDRPLSTKDAVAFRSPDSTRVSFDLPNAVDGAEHIEGMGVPKGVTLIVGGGYHGKSTLLHALQRGVYPHIPGDGREYVVATRDAVKIRAEDGRRVERVDISPFISDLPYGRSTTAFTSEDASGSTSQAANILEAIEVGATVLLLDEDTSATNFMVRDARMQALVHKEHEPITPFLDRVRELYDTLGVSTVLVMGGCGDYFDAADRVIMMRDYVPYDVTNDARAVAEAHATTRRAEAAAPLQSVVPRCPKAASFDASRGRRDVKIDARGLDTIGFGTDTIDLRNVEQWVDPSQVRAVGHAIYLAAQRFMRDGATLREVVDAVEASFDEAGLDELDPFHRAEHHPGNYARPRKYELAAAINRLRTVRMNQRDT
jgi:predicted ABC-class ATPase